VKRTVVIIFIFVAMLIRATTTMAQDVANPVPPQPLTISGAATYVYKTVGGYDLRLHIFTPQDYRISDRRPAIVFFFGGGLLNGSVEQFVPQSRHFAERGIVAVVADYRVRRRHQTNAFDAINDAKSVIRWLRQRSSSLGINPNRIVAAGGSSGGHLAAATAILDGFDVPIEDQNISSRPNLLVLFNPVVEPSETSEVYEGRARDASPFHHLRAGLPPFILFHGTADTTVPYASVQRFCAASTTLGNVCVLKGYSGATHGFFNYSQEGGRWYRETIAAADAFLVDHGYLPRQ
jgi:acetyl esterase/lipase